jgi:hypothetical protein
VHSAAWGRTVKPPRCCGRPAGLRWLPKGR